MIFKINFDEIMFLCKHIIDRRTCLQGNRSDGVPVVKWYESAVEKRSQIPFILLVCVCCFGCECTICAPVSRSVCV